MGSKKPSCPVLYWESITPDQFVGWLGLHRDSMFCNNIIPFYVLRRCPREAGKWSTLTGNSLRGTLRTSVENGNIFLTHTLMFASSKEPERLYSLLRGITEESPTGLQHIAVPACLLVIDVLETTPYAAYSGYDHHALALIKSLMTNFYPQIHQAEVNRPPPNLAVFQARDAARPEEYNQHKQVLRHQYTSLKRILTFYPYRTLFGQQPPVTRRTWAELMPGPHGYDDFPRDLTEISDGDQIHLILLTRPNEDKDIDPVKLTWSLPMASEMLDVVSAAILNLHGGDIKRAADTVSTLLKQSDFSTGSIWITPHDWVTFDFFRIFIRASTRGGRRFETFPAYGITITVPPPQDLGLYRYTAITQSPDYLHATSLPQQANPPKTRRATGSGHHSSPHSRIPLRGLGLGLTLWGTMPMMKQNNVAFLTNPFLLSFNILCLHRIKHVYLKGVILTESLYTIRCFNYAFSKTEFILRRGTTADATSTLKNIRALTLISGTVVSSFYPTSRLSSGRQPTAQSRSKCSPSTETPVYSLSLRQHPPRDAPKPPRLNISSSEEVTPKPPRVEKMARTKTRMTKVRTILPSTSYKPPCTNQDISPTGNSGCNIFNTEKGTPKPPREEIRARTKTRTTKVRTTLHITYYKPPFINHDISPAGNSEYNIFITEKGTPKPPREEIRASTTATNLRVITRPYTTKGVIDIKSPNAPGTRTPTTTPPPANNNKSRTKNSTERTRRLEELNLANCKPAKTHVDDQQVSTLCPTSLLKIFNEY